MNYINIKARAKINLSLNVLRRRPDGYHDIEMIMQSIGLFDEIHLEKLNNGIEIETDSSIIPNGQDNIAFKAAKNVIDECNIKSGLKIHIVKKIPVAAGLAGGSADAAGVIKGMNTLFQLGLSDEDMMKIGLKVGADVPFCIKGGTMLARGIGEKLEELYSFSGVDILLVKPDIEVSTAWVYNNLDLNLLKTVPNTDLLVSATKSGDYVSVAKSMANVLESVTEKKYHIISKIKARMIELGAIGSMMSGSGPTVFGIFKNGQESQKAAETFRQEGFKEVFSVKTV